MTQLKGTRISTDHVFINDSLYLTRKYVHFSPADCSKYNFLDDWGRQLAYYNMFELLEYHHRILSKITWNNTNVELLRFN